MVSVNKLLAGKRTNKVLALSPAAMVFEALELMATENIGAVMIMDGDKLVGIFSERDYARKGIIQGRKAKSTPDFINKLKIVEEESDETVYWLELIQAYNNLNYPQFDQLLKESRELERIFSASVITAKNNNKLPNRKL